MKSFNYIATLSVFLSGCCLGPNYQVPEMEVPEQWHAPNDQAVVDCESSGLLWWENLHDGTLNYLIHLAASQNLDLQMAAIRVLKARMEVNGQQASLYPRLDGSLNSGHIDYSKDGMVNGLLSNTLPIACHDSKHHFNFFEFGFDALWEIDLFGRTKHEIAAAKAHEEAIQEELGGIWVTLSAEVAKNYIELRGLQARREVIKKNIALQDEIIKLFEELSGRGHIKENELHYAKAEWRVLKSELPALELSIHRSIHRLSTLLGYPPGGLYECLAIGFSLPKVPKCFSISPPSELLRRRPDIRKAERELASATEKVGSAVASLFPRFSIRGFFGEVSRQIGSLFCPSNMTTFVGPQVLIPIFNSKLILQDVKYSKLSTQEAIINYQKVILEALEEAENAIGTYYFQEQSFNELDKALADHKAALALTEDLYQRGISDGFTRIKAKKALTEMENKILQSQQSLLLAYISIYKAMGGNWE